MIKEGISSYLRNYNLKVVLCLTVTNKLCLATKQQQLIKREESSLLFILCFFLCMTLFQKINDVTYDNGFFFECLHEVLRIYIIPFTYHL